MTKENDTYCITLVGTSFRSEKYLEKYFSNILRLENIHEIKCILILNEPSLLERTIADNYGSQYPEIFKCILLDKRESIAASLNRGFAEASTHFVTYMDVDDIRAPYSFVVQKETLLQNTNVDFTYGDFIVVENQGDMHGRFVKVSEFDRNEFTRGCYVSPTHFYRRNLFDKIGFWDEQLRSGADFEFQARAAAAEILFKKTNSTLLYYTKEEDSKSASSGILQPVERTVVELRYGIYDKIDYDYYDEALKYRIFEIKHGDDWIPLSWYIRNYRQFLREREHLIPKGKRRHLIRQLITKPVKRSLRKPLQSIGMYEKVRHLIQK